MKYCGFFGAGPLALLLSACGSGGGEGTGDAAGPGSVVVAPEAAQAPSSTPATALDTAAMELANAGAAAVHPKPTEPAPPKATQPPELGQPGPDRPVIIATPASIQTVLAAATGGQTVRLSPGDYGRIVIRDRRFPDGGLVIEAPATARFSVTLQQVDGITLRGVSLTGARGDGALGYAGYILDSRNVVFDKVTATDSTRGVVVNRSQDITFLDATLQGLRTDGIDIAASQRVTIDGASCHNFSPIEGDHPDCIQAWSSPDGIVSDILVTNVHVEGTMQGIFFGTPDAGGFDRVRISNNVVIAGYGNGIGLYACRNCELTGNVVSTFPGSPNQSRVVMVGGTIKHYGNSHAPYNGKPGWSD